MKISYGTIDKNIDVTEICLNKLTKNNIITIPINDHNRAKYFTDPVFFVKKNIYVLINDQLTEYADNVRIKINIINETIETKNTEQYISKLKNIHSKLRIKYGNFDEEYPEQTMVTQYFTGNEKVLEIGGNIGRNSLIIGHILRENNNNNFVTLESDSHIAKKLRENRNLNNMKFYIENSALSKRKLIQKGWETIVSKTLLDGYKNVNTITYDELYSKYNIKFDTLVLDCEGAFYYILMDMPEILDNIKLIIMENDYLDINKKQYIDKILNENNFYVDYVESGGWGPCYDNFFEVWKKD